MRNVVIVGGGLGGLASAVYLAQAGYQVTLFEKSTEPGGGQGLVSLLLFTFLYQL